MMCSTIKKRGLREYETLNLIHDMSSTGLQCSYLLCIEFYPIKLSGNLYCVKRFRVTARRGRSTNRACPKRGLEIEPPPPPGDDLMTTTSLVDFHTLSITKTSGNRNHTRLHCILTALKPWSSPSVALLAFTSLLSFTSCLKPLRTFMVWNQ